MIQIFLSFLYIIQFFFRSNSKNDETPLTFIHKKLILHTSSSALMKKHTLAIKKTYIFYKIFEILNCGKNRNKEQQQQNAF